MDVFPNLVICTYTLSLFFHFLCFISHHLPPSDTVSPLLIYLFVTYLPLHCTERFTWAGIFYFVLFCSLLYSNLYNHWTYNRHSKKSVLKEWIFISVWCKYQKTQMRLECIWNQYLQSQKKIDEPWSDRLGDYHTNDGTVLSTPLYELIVQRYVSHFYTLPQPKVREFIKYLKVCYSSNPFRNIKISG